MKILLNSDSSIYCHYTYLPTEFEPHTALKDTVHL